MGEVQKLLEQVIAYLGDAERQGAITLIGTFIGALIVGFWYFWKERGTHNLNHGERAQGPLAQVAGSEIRLTIEEYDQRLRKRELEIEELIKDAQASALPNLEAQLKELKLRIADIEPAYKNSLERIYQLESVLRQSSPSVSNERLSEAVRALEGGNYTLADKIFIEVAQRQEPYLKLAARAAFGRGLIAEEQVDWPKAAEQFASASSFERSEANLIKASLYLWRSGDYQSAAAVSKEVLTMISERGGEESEEYAGMLNNMGTQYYELGLTQEALACFEKSLAIKRRLKLVNTMDYAGNLANLANVNVFEGKFANAERLHRQAFASAEAAMAQGDGRYSALVNGLAEILRINGKYEEAEKYFLIAINGDENKFGKEHPNVARDLHFYAKLLVDKKLLKQANEVLTRAFGIDRVKLGDYHPHTLHTAHFLAFILRKLPRSAQSALLLKELKEAYGPLVGKENKVAVKNSKSKS